MSVFGWSIAIMLAACFAASSWAWCYLLFHFPEVPRHQELRALLGREFEPKVFDKSEIPKAEVLGPEAAYGKYITLPQKDIDMLNARYRRLFLSNYEDTQLLAFVQGTWKVLAIRLLQEEDFITTGYAIKAQAHLRRRGNEEGLPFPTYLEVIIPTKNKPPTIKTPSKTFFSMDRIPDGLALLNIHRGGTVEEPEICLTAIPLTYKPPEELAKLIPHKPSAPKTIQAGANWPLFPYENAR